MNACQHFISKKPEAWIVILHALLALFGGWDGIINIISYGLDSTGFISWLVLEIFCSQNSSKPDLGPISLKFNGNQGSFPQLKQLEHEVSHFSPSSTMVTPPLCLHGTYKDHLFFIEYESDGKI